MRVMGRAVGAAAVGACVLLAGCAGTDDAADGESTPASTTSSSSTSTSSASSTPALSGAITVLAAASLTDAFTEIGAQVEADNPGTTVTLSFGASSALVEQVTAGAPADVLATANTSTMQTVVDGGLAQGPQVFATNQLQIAVPPDNPGQVDDLADLAAGASPDRVVALCAPEVPCGSAAGKAFEVAGLTAAADTLEPDVRSVLTKVTLGEVDAGLVYRSDVVAAGADVVGVDFPEAAQASTQDPVVVLADAANPELAAAFVEAVTGPEGQELLARYGFGAP